MLGNAEISGYAGGYREPCDAAVAGEMKESGDSSQRRSKESSANPKIPTGFRLKAQGWIAGAMGRDSTLGEPDQKKPINPESVVARGSFSFREYTANHSVPGPGTQSFQG